MLFLLLTDT